MMNNSILPVLDVNQVQYLEDTFGFKFINASLIIPDVWNDGIIHIEDTYHLDSNWTKIETYNPETGNHDYQFFPTYTLQDILNILPEGTTLITYKADGIHYKISLKDNSKSFSCKSSLEAAYNMLVYCLENKLIKQ